jgi:hypothetical protein
MTRLLEKLVAAALLALACGACTTIAEPGATPAPTTATVPASDAAQCAIPPDSLLRECGGADCRPAANGTVSCVFSGPFCLYTSKGMPFRCGGKVVSCAPSPDRHTAVCGGVTTPCKTSADGRMVLCGSAN